MHKMHQTLVLLFFFSRINLSVSKLNIFLKIQHFRIRQNQNEESKDKRLSPFGMSSIYRKRDLEIFCDLVSKQPPYRDEKIFNFNANSIILKRRISKNLLLYGKKRGESQRIEKLTNLRILKE